MVCASGAPAKNINSASLATAQKRPERSACTMDIAAVGLVITTLFSYLN